MMMLGGVPIRVTSPPRIEPKDRGISRVAAARLALAADCKATGMSRPRVPTLFMKPESAAATAESAPTWVEVRLVAGAISRAIQSVAPEEVSARLTISTTATVMVAGWPKPEKASRPGTKPATTQASNAAKATTS
jgi:hypothetical protein